MTCDLPTKADIDQLRELVDRMDRKLELALSFLPAKRTITVPEIAKREGVSERSLSGSCQYLLPRFGESGFPDGHRRWLVSEYLDWSARPAEERKKEWLASLDTERRMAIKAMRKAMAI